MPPFWAIPAFWVYLLTWAPFASFLILYGLRSPWRATSTGRGIFTLTASMVAVLSNALAGVMLGDYPGRDLVRLILVGGVACAGWNLLRNLIGLQHEAGRGSDTASPDLADRGPR